MRDGAIVWFQKDLRLNDNPAFHHACANHHRVLCLYILDESFGSAQKWWLYKSLSSLRENLKKRGLDLVLQKGDPESVLKKLKEIHTIHHVYCNHVPWRQKLPDVLYFPANLLIHPQDIFDASHKPFKVFTYFWKKCLQRIADRPLLTGDHYPLNIPSESDDLESFGLLPRSPDWAESFSAYWTPGEEEAHQSFQRFLTQSLKDYKKDRDFPEKQKTSRLSPHLHFGEISIHLIWKNLKNFPPSDDLESFLSELGWREFSYYLLYHYPSLSYKNFQPIFDHFPWENRLDYLEKWQRGETGYPLVDAGMRELWQTGYMHNRVRMIVASFLTKHLLVDWKEGAKWFMDTLLDADIASNTASWQWVAGCGCDAAPYFRIFNPLLQAEKFDAQEIYIKKWLPYPYDFPPIVDHPTARQKALMLYQKMKSEK